ncbi:MAG: hypothetical protein WCB69_02045, partial [Pseudolabrys sp.]
GRAGADPNGSVVVADLDHAGISEAVVTRDQTARRTCHVNGGGVGVGNGRGPDQRAGGNTDADAGAPGESEPARCRWWRRGCRRVSVRSKQLR